MSYLGARSRDIKKANTHSKIGTDPRDGVLNQKENEEFTFFEGGFFIYALKKAKQ